MDPKAAAMVLETLKEMLKIDVDTSTLENEAKIIDEKVKHVMSKAKSAHSDYRKVQDESSLGSMYG